LGSDALHSLYEYFTGEDLWIGLGKTFLGISVIIILAYAVIYPFYFLRESHYKSDTNS